MGSAPGGGRAPPRGYCRIAASRSLPWLVASVLLIGVLFVVDRLVGPATSFAASFGIAALIAALGASPRATAGVAVVAIVASAIDNVLNHRTNETQDVIRLVTTTTTAGLAVWAAALRVRLLARVRRERLLAGSAELLASTEDYRATLEAVAQSAVPEFADWCGLDLVGSDGTIDRVAVAHRDPAQVARAHALQARYPATLEDASGTGKVLRTGEGEWVLDVPPGLIDAAARDEEHRELLRALEIRSGMTLPLLARGRTLGAITFVMAESGRRFSRSDVETGRELARRCALTIDNARLLDETRTTQARLHQAFALLDAIFERAPVGLAFFDRELRYVRINDRLAEINGVGPEGHMGRRVHEVLPDMDPTVEDQLRAVLEGADPITDAETVGETPAQPGRVRDYLASYWPVRQEDGEVIGLGAVVIEVTERRAAERALRSQTDRYETLLLALSEVGEGMVVLEDEGLAYANPAFETMTGYGFDELRAMASIFELVVPEHRDEARRRARRRIEDATVDPHYTLALRRRDGRVLELEVAGVPLDVEGHRQLVVVARDVTARRRAEDERERLLVLEREAREEAERAHARARLLADASEAFDEVLDVARTLEAAAGLAVREQAATCAIHLRRGDGSLRRAVAAREPALAAALEALPLRTALAPEGPLARVLATGRSVVIPDLADPARVPGALADQHVAALARLGVRSVVAVALRARGRTLGVLTAGFDAPRAGAEAREGAALFADLARRTALSLDNARLYEERTEVARTLQRSLLPSELPAVPGVQLAARYLAAGEGNEVGGDFYDVFALGGGEWALVIGDVCGKGAEAAAITALARYTIRAAVLHTHRPARVLAELNEALLRQELDFRFCTVQMTALRPLQSGGMALRVASGGHPLPLVVRHDGRVESAGRPGTLLGVVGDPQLPEDELLLEPGDALVLYTDGVIEASPLDDAFGPDRFASFLADWAGRDADEVAEAIERAVLDVQSGPPRDDVAVLVLRVSPGETVPLEALAGAAGAGG